MEEDNSCICRPPMLGTPRPGLGAVLIKWPADEDCRVHGDGLTVIERAALKAAEACGAEAVAAALRAGGKARLCASD